MLSDERIIEIAKATRTAEPGGTGGYMLPIAFARAIEREATAEATRLLELSLLGLDCAAKCESPEFLAHVLAGDAIREYLGRMK